MMTFSEDPFLTATTTEEFADFDIVDGITLPRSYA